MLYEPAQNHKYIRALIYESVLPKHKKSTSMRKQFLIFILLVLILLVFNNILLGRFNSDSELFGKHQLLNTSHVSSQRLFDRTWKTVKDKFYDSSLNRQNWDRWKKHYKGKIKNDDDANIAINTMLESLDDPYSRYLNKQNYEEQTNSINSKISGIGANISSIKGSTYVISVIPDAPAQKAGLKGGDLILKVNGKNVHGMNTMQVVNFVRGPIGSTVVLTIKRDKKIFIKKIVRKEIKIKTVESSVDKNIGYIRVMSFIGEHTSEEFISAIERTGGTKGLIIDLRGNTGGLLPNAVFMANVFIDQGNIVSIVGRNGYRVNINAQQIDYKVNKPVLILVDQNSASASEIFSGALKDYHKARLLGTRTYGKAMVQKIFPMPNQTGLNLTIARYLTPSGHDINKKGISPDIEVKESMSDLRNRKDTQLAKAKIIISEMIVQNKN